MKEKKRAKRDSRVRRLLWRVCYGIACAKGLIWQLRVWTRCKPDGTEEAARRFHRTISLPWLIGVGIALWSPLFATLTIAIDGLVFSSALGVDPDEGALAKLISVCALVFAVKVSCGAVLLCVTAWVAAVSLLAGGAPSFVWLMEAFVDEVIMPGMPEWIFYAYLLWILGSALYDSVRKGCEIGLDAVIRESPKMIIDT